MNYEDYFKSLGSSVTNVYLDVERFMRFTELALIIICVLLLILVILVIILLFRR